MKKQFTRFLCAALGAAMLLALAGCGPKEGSGGDGGGDKTKVAFVS